MIYYRAGLLRLEEIVDDSKGPVLADEYAGLLGPLIASTERREFPMILIKKPPYAAGIERARWTQEMQEATADRYACQARQRQSK